MSGGPKSLLLSCTTGVCLFFNKFTKCSVNQSSDGLQIIAMAAIKSKLPSIYTTSVSLLQDSAGPGLPGQKIRRAGANPTLSVA